MIPKIIHYVWIGAEMPEKAKRCLASWRAHMPGYELRRWDVDALPADKRTWAMEAIAAKTTAFAADYLRCYALYHCGGIYFDCDVEVLKPFDPLLSLPYALGYENGSGCIEAAVMAAEPGHPIFKRMLDYYDAKQRFVNPDGSLCLTPLPRLMRDVAIPPLRVVPIDSPDQFDHDPACLCLLPFDYFSPIHLEHRELQISPRTYTIHHFAASWQRGWKKHRDAIKRLLGPRLTRAAIRAKRALFGRSAD